jgi:HK97 family phage prohead protease
MTTTAPARRQKTWHVTEARLELRAEGDTLPAGIAGRVAGVALTYDVVDTYGTMFQRGAANQSIATKVKARKVPLLMDHDRSVASHVGVVATMSEVGDTLVMVADLFDTPDGRAALEYVKAVMAAGASTGFSIGFVPRASQRVMVDGQPVELFTEIELREVSITPMPAVPGADVTAARTEDPTELEPVRDERTLLVLAAEVALRALTDSDRQVVWQRVGFRGDALPPETAPDAATAQAAADALAHRSAIAGHDASRSDAPSDALPAPVSMEARAHAVRQTFHVTPY